MATRKPSSFVDYVGAVEALLRTKCSLKPSEATWLTSDRDIRFVLSMAYDMRQSPAHALQAVLCGVLHSWVKRNMPKRG